MMRLHDSITNRSTPSAERGATAVEYALIVGFIAAVIILTVTLVGLDTLANFERADW